MDGFLTPAPAMAEDPDDLPIATLLSQDAYNCQNSGGDESDASQETASLPSQSEDDDDVGSKTDDDAGDEDNQCALDVDDGPSDAAEAPPENCSSGSRQRTEPTPHGDACLGGRGVVRVAATPGGKGKVAGAERKRAADVHAAAGARVSVRSFFTGDSPTASWSPGNSPGLSPDGEGQFRLRPDDDVHDEEPAVDSGGESGGESGDADSAGAGGAGAGAGGRCATSAREYSRDGCGDSAGSEWQSRLLAAERARASGESSWWEHLSENASEAMLLGLLRSTR
jgi:hypothetical protein